VRMTLLLGAILIALCSTASTVIADVEAVERTRAGLGANDLSDIAFDGNYIWVVGSGSITKRLWGDGSKYSDWMSYSAEPNFGKGSIGAIMATEDIIIMSWVFNDLYGESYYPFTDGFSLSLDKGESWSRVEFLDLYPERSTSSFPGFMAATYDFDFSEGTLYAAVMSSFLFKSDDLGQTWEGIYPNADYADVNNHNHYGFSVDAYSDTLWVGTYQGINLSVDRGDTWENFSWTGDEAETIENPKPGNFCLAVEHKVVGGKTHVWVSSDLYENRGMRGIFHTSDNGQTWDYQSKIKAWNFAFGHKNENNPAVSDSTIYASTPTGLIVSHDLGTNWSNIEIAEPDSIVSIVDGKEIHTEAPAKRWDSGTQVYGLTVASDSLWVTSSDGIAVSGDWGDSWQIFKGVTRVKTIDEGRGNIGVASAFDETRTYPFPNPFSPKRTDRDYSRCRIQYALTKDADVSISIHDYSGRIIRDLLDSEVRLGGNEYQEVWDGRDGEGGTVPNGVYFYIIKTNKGDTARGKIMVVD